MWHCLRDPKFSRFSRTPTYDERTDGQTNETDTRRQLRPVLASVARVIVKIGTASFYGPAAATRARFSRTRRDWFSQLHFQFSTLTGTLTPTLTFRNLINFFLV